MDQGGYLRPQVAARAFGMMIGWQGYHPFGKRPTYQRLAAAHAGDALFAELARPEVRDAILSETDDPADPALPFDGIGQFLQMALDQLYVIGSECDYEPTRDRSVASLAAAAGVDPLRMCYDLLNTDGGRAFLMLPLLNYVDASEDVIHEMLTNPTVINGLGDGGAHVRMICDASMPTYLLTHWARDRRRGPRIELEEAVRLQTSATAEFLGFDDRGVVAPGRKADLNVIDFENLRLEYPHAADDLPAGGRRLLQGATGYVATVVNGVVTRRHGADTGARPGRLVRA